MPGSRNAKRWQDVEELLAAGIDVLSTVNVQHLESLNDVVEQITGAHQHETVPDDVVRRAEQTRADRHHPGGAAATARTRQRLPGAPHRRRARQLLPARQPHRAAGAGAAVGRRPGRRRARSATAPSRRSPRPGRPANGSWSPSPAAPESETLIRRATRIANRAGAELLVLHILRGDGLSGVGPAGVGELRKLADDVGATFHTVVGDDVPAALLDFARGANATQLVLGTSRRSRLARAVQRGHRRRRRAGVRLDRRAHGHARRGRHRPAPTPGAAARSPGPARRSAGCSRSCCPVSRRWPAWCGAAS